MNGKTNSTEQESRILRAADAGNKTTYGCRGPGISEKFFPTWKREFGMLEFDQGRKMNELQEEIITVSSPRF